MGRGRVVFVWASAGLLGCGADAVAPTGADRGAAEVPSGGGAHVFVSASSLDVGPVDCGGASQRRQSVVVTNGGSAQLTFAASVPAGAPFEVHGASTGTLAPGASATLAIAPLPVDAATNAGMVFSSTLDIATNDATRPHVEVTLTATASGATLRLQPAAVDFGDVEVGQATELPVTVTNVGNADAVLLAPVTAGDFDLTWEDGSGRILVPPGQTASGVARFRPTADVEEAASLVLASAGPTCGASTIGVATHGIGTAPAAQPLPLPPPPPYAACESYRDCNGPIYNVCSADHHCRQGCDCTQCCSAGQACTGGDASPPPGVPPPGTCVTLCATTADCDYGQTCTGGQCGYAM